MVHEVLVWPRFEARLRPWLISYLADAVLFALSYTGAVLRFARTLLRLAARAVVRPTGRLDLSGDFGRLIFSLLAFVGVAWAVPYLLPSGEDWEIRATAGWDVAAAVYLCLTWA